MYLPSDAPIPIPDPTSRLAASNRRLAQTQCQVNRGRRIVYQTVPSDASFNEVSPVLAGNASQLLGQSDVSRASVIGSGTPPVSSLITGGSEQLAPIVVPMNPDSQTGSCVRTIAAPTPVSAPAPTIPVMPKPAPALPVPTTAPRYTNLCWALRNGVVDASQFARDDLAKLQYACSQKGYVGACPPPPAVFNYLTANRGRLPMIPVTQAVIDAIPNAPPLQGVKCPESYQLGGLTGIAAPWGDAGLYETPPGASPSGTAGNSGFVGWVKAHPWLSLGALAGLAFLATDEKRRGRRGY